MLGFLEKKCVLFPQNDCFMYERHQKQVRFSKNVDVFECRYLENDNGDVLSIIPISL